MSAAQNGYNLRRRSSLLNYAQVAKGKCLQPTGEGKLQQRRQVVKRRRTTGKRDAAKRGRLSCEQTPLENGSADVEGDHATGSNSDEASDSLHIHDLPEGVVGRILRRLEPKERVAAELVCRRWCHISRIYGWMHQRSLTKTMIWSDYDNISMLREELSREERSPMVAKRLDCIISRCSKYLHLTDLTGLGDSLNYSVCNLFNGMLQLETLNLTGIQLTNTSIATIGEYLPQLKSICLRGCFQATQVERGLTSLFASCRSLHSLDVANNYHLAGVPSFSKLPSTIRSLNISGCLQLQPPVVDHLLETCAAELREFYMDQVELGSTMADMNRLFARMSKLELLQYRYRYYSRTGGNDSAHMVGLGELANVKTMLLSDNNSVTDLVLKAIGNGCKELEKLDLSQSGQKTVTDVGLRALSRLPKLSVLVAKEQRQLSSATIGEVAKNGTLRELNVRSCEQLTDAAIEQLLERCKGLRRLDVSYCPLLTEKSAKALVSFLNDLLVAKSRPPTTATGSEPSQQLQKSSSLSQPAKKKTEFVLHMCDSGMRNAVAELAKHPLLEIKQMDDHLHIYLGQLFQAQDVLPLHRQLGRVVFRHFDIMPDPFFLP